MALPVPYINGVMYDPSSYEIKIDGVIATLVKSLTYGDGLSPTDIFAAGNPGKVGRTRGVYSCESSIEFYIDGARDFLSKLQTKIGGTGDGYGEAVFTIGVHIYEPPQPAIIHTLVGCRVVKVGDEMPGAGGSDTTTQKFDLNMMWIERNGKRLYKVKS